MEEDGRIYWVLNPPYPFSGFTRNLDLLKEHNQKVPEKSGEKWMAACEYFAGQGITPCGLPIMIFR